METVQLVLFLTDGIAFDEAKKQLDVRAEDLLKAERYASEKDKLLHLVSAHLKKKYVGEWTTLKTGKPIANGVFFSVSHCAGAVVLALAEKDVGVDIETVREINPALTDRVASEKERAFIKTEKDFLRVWTAKESLAKAEGRGIAQDLKTIPALPLNGEKEYRGEKYYSQQVEDGGFIITVTRKGAEPFTFDIKKER